MAKRRKDQSEPEHPSPEPQGGPTERARAFLEERLTPLRRKSDGPTTKPDVPPSKPTSRTRRDVPSARPAAESLDDTGPAAPAPKRRDVIKQYRNRQKRSQSAPPAVPQGADDASAEMAPAPPPANNWVPIRSSAKDRAA
jgi:hypothetical protein